MFRRSRYLNCNRDPRWIKAKFSGTCAGCKGDVMAGEDAYYFPVGRKIFCSTCGEIEHGRFQDAVADEKFYNSQY